VEGLAGCARRCRRRPLLVSLTVLVFGWPVSSPMPVMAGAPGCFNRTIGGGNGHMLALRSDGAVWAWGSNFFGQAGTGTILSGDASNITSPSEVVAPGGGFLGGIVAVAGGQDHSLALTSAGTVWAWGDNYYGQLGNGTTSDQAFGGTTSLSGVPIPVQVLGSGGTGLFTNVAQVAAGNIHSLALRADGTVWSWGYNGFGQLGNGTTSNSLLPVEVQGLSGAMAVAAGLNNSYALGTDGTVWAWGDNTYGQLGTGAMTRSLVPVKVTGLSGMVAISGQFWHVLALKADGTVWAWGRNDFYQLGTGSATAHGTGTATPVQVPNLSNVVAVSGGPLHSLALKSDGTVWGWGTNADGELGLGSAVAVPHPTQLPALTQIVEVTANAFTTMALKSDGSVWTTGDNFDAQLGLGFQGGGFFTSFGRVIGPNAAGFLTGVALPAAPCTVVPPAPPPTVHPRCTTASIAAGGDHALAVLDSGGVVAWGNDDHGQLGNAVHLLPNNDGGGGTSALPVGVLPIYPFQLPVQVAAGGAQSSALEPGGSVTGWGANGLGQLGDSLTNDSSYPIGVTGVSSALTVAAGSGHSLAVLADGTVVAWGVNGFGQLGDGTTTPYEPAAVPVSGLQSAVTVAAGGAHSLALTADDQLWAWGANNRGQLGDSSTATHTRPVVVPLSGAVALAAGTIHSLALDANGNVWAWGANTDGQLGLGNNTDSGKPQEIGSLSQIAGIAAGFDHSLAVDASGLVWAWGNNGHGQLGLPLTAGSSSKPVPVPGLSQIVEVAAGFRYSLALDRNGTVLAWGDNTWGQLGDGTDADRSTPKPVLHLTPVAAPGPCIRVGIHGLRVNQSGDARDINGDGIVDLVAERPTLVRVRLEIAGGASFGTTPVAVQLALQGQAIQQSATMDQLGSLSLDFILDTSSATGKTAVVATVDPAKLLAVPGSGSSFHMPIDVKSVRAIYYAFLPDPWTGPIPPSTMASTVATSRDYLQAVYPLSPAHFTTQALPQFFRQLPPIIRNAYASWAGFLTDNTSVWLVCQRQTQGKAEQCIAVTQQQYFPDHMLGKNTIGYSLGIVPAVFVVPDHPLVTAHELGHSYGFAHLDAPANGYWVELRREITDVRDYMNPTTPDTPNYPDNAVAPFSGRWTTGDHFVNLFQQFRTNPTDPEVLLVTGDIRQDGTAVFGPLYNLPNGNVSRPAPGDASVRILDRFGRTLAEVPFTVDFRLNIEPPDASVPATLPAMPFALAVPFPVGATTLQVVWKGTAVAETQITTELLRTAIASVPQSGFVTDPIQRQDALLNKVNALAAQLEAGDFLGAEEKLRQDLRPRLVDWLLDGYATGSALELSKTEVLQLTDELIGRLQT